MNCGGVPLKLQLQGAPPSHTSLYSSSNSLSALPFKCSHQLWVLPPVVVVSAMSLCVLLSPQILVWWFALWTQFFEGSKKSYLSICYIYFFLCCEIGSSNLQNLYTAKLNRHHHVVLNLSFPTTMNCLPCGHHGVSVLTDPDKPGTSDCRGI